MTIDSTLLSRKIKLRKNGEVIKRKSKPETSRGGNTMRRKGFGVAG